MIIDTHCHLYMDAFDADREAVIVRAREFGVKYIINVGEILTQGNRDEILVDEKARQIYLGEHFQM